MFSQVRRLYKVATEDLRLSTKLFVAALLPSVLALLAFAAIIGSSGFSDHTDLLILGSLCACFGVGVASARVVSTTISARLRQIVSLTEEIARTGRAPSAVKGKDEIAQLDRFIRQMALSRDEAHRREQAVIMNVGDAICSLNRSGNILFANPAASQIWGYDRGKLAGMSIFDLIERSDSERLQAIIQEIQPAVEPDAIELAGIKCDGTSVFLLASISCELGAQDRMFCVFHDITERKRLERMKQEFVAMVSHDLRTPLGALRLTLENLESGAYGTLAENGLLAVKRSDSELARLIRMINMLLDYEKMESGEFELDVSDHCIDDAVNNAITAVRLLAEARRITLKYVERHERATFDLDKIVQVLINLLSNSIKYSPQNSTIQVFSQLDQSGVLHLSVIDQGRGIPAEHQQRIFERYRQVEREDNSKKGGVGLGLAICKLIVEKHGGQIGVDSEAGKGSTFWLALPPRVHACDDDSRDRANSTH
jgi:PAS domain S-box-containing protein